MHLVSKNNRETDIVLLLEFCSPIPARYYLKLEGFPPNH